MGDFVEMFRFDPTEEEPEGEAELTRPAWLGPAEDELGVCVAESLVLGRSEKGVVALRHATAYSNGVAIELMAAARGLRTSEANSLFHEQHLFDQPDDIPDAFLRVGIEFADGSRASNLGGRRLWRKHDDEPEGPVIVQSGGGGGSAGHGRVTMHPVYWIWPLPPPGKLRLFVEWPALGVGLSEAELDTTAILEAASASQTLWDD